MSPEESKAALIEVLQSAHAGEYAASLAYDGHAKSVSDPVEAKEIRRILEDELEHRALVRGLLESLGAAPDSAKERKLALIGGAISLLCRVGGWFIPMYGAGRLEAGNIAEYEVAARHAIGAGRRDMLDCLLKMAEVEWDHELYFRRKVESSAWSRVVPLWRIPPPRESIRGVSSSGRRA